VRLYRLSAEGGDARAMYNLALALQAGEGAPRDLAEAERWFRKGVEAGDPVDSPNSLAYLLARQDRDLDEAATLADAALKAAPDSAPVQDTLALVRLKQGRLTEAATLMRRAVKADDRALYRVRLGDIYARMGLRAEAEAQWRAALAARPGRWVDDELKPEDVRRRLAPPAATTR
jgi:TPR repeat protein